MAYFPMCVDLRGKTVALVGEGEQTRAKAEALKPFGARVVALPRFAEAEFPRDAALAVVGDLPLSQAEEVARLCARRGVPVNVVDAPQLSTFCFPALICEGDLTISISTGGRSPCAAAHLRRWMRSLLPVRAGEIVERMAEHAQALRKDCPHQARAAVLRALTARAFEEDRPPTGEDVRRALEAVRSSGEADKSAARA